VKVTKWDVDRGLRDTMKDPTRAFIFNELLMAEEVSGSTLAARLGVPAQNLYYHLHRLAEWGIVETVREEVVRGCWVEKYYRLSDDLTRVLSYQLSPIDEALQGATAEEKRATIVSLLNMASAVIAQSAQRYASMDADEFARLLDEERLVMVTFGVLERGQFVRALKAARDHRQQVEWQPPSAGGAEATAGDQVVIACMPGVVVETGLGERPARSTTDAAAPASRP
jgi:DNA-binding transcriptional ArsR family regulator